MKIAKREHNYLIAKDDGTNVVLTGNEASLLMNYIRRENLRDLIDCQVSDAEDDWLDLSKYDGPRDEFIDEIFDALVDEIDYGNPVTEEQVEDQISDLASIYDLEKEE